MAKILKQAFELSGVGLHSGVTTTVRVVPETVGRGRYFVRTDLPHQPIIPANLAAVSQTVLSTELATKEAKVRTVEHLLAALAASEIDDARIEINGAEVPLLDGSAQLWIEAITRSGIKPGTAKPPNFAFFKSTPIWIQEKDAFVVAIPSSETRFTYGIDFPEYKAIANQWHSWHPATADFATEIAPARTFGFAEQIEQLQQAGLIKGGNLNNALVCSQTGWLNPPLRFTNEPARHKLLDLVGDMSLLGSLPPVHFLAYKASHQLHVQLARTLANNYQLK
ncbi:MAG TPA: UDP-3-O-acyl-N-acetylglucosamine deacetylase [Xenococcaceae cyanobacterium]